MRLQCLRHAREHFFLPELVAKILKLRDSTKSKVLFPHLKKKKDTGRSPQKNRKNITEQKQRQKKLNMKVLSKAINLA